MHKNFNNTSIKFINSLLDWIITYTTFVVWFIGPDRFKFILFKLTQVMTIQDVRIERYWYHETRLMTQSYHKSWSVNIFFLFLFLSSSIYFLIIFRHLPAISRFFFFWRNLFENTKKDSKTNTIKQSISYFLEISFFIYRVKLDITLVTILMSVLLLCLKIR